LQESPKIFDPISTKIFEKFGLRKCSDR
jgi:hypothetical protein